MPDRRWAQRYQRAPHRRIPNGAVIPLPNTMTDMAVINFPRKYAFFAENSPIEKTVTSYKNHEFIPPGRKTRNGPSTYVIEKTSFVKIKVDTRVARELSYSALPSTSSGDENWWRYNFFT